MIPVKKRPRHKVGSIPCCGQSFDSLDYLPTEIRRQQDSLEEMRNTAAMNPDYSRSFFVRFRTQMDANIFAQQTLHHTPMVMASKYTDLARDDVLFDNLRIHGYEATIRKIVSWGLTIGIIIA